MEPTKWSLSKCINQDILLIYVSQKNWQKTRDGHFHLFLYSINHIWLKKKRIHVFFYFTVKLNLLGPCLTVEIGSTSVHTNSLQLVKLQVHVQIVLKKMRSFLQNKVKYWPHTRNLQQYFLFLPPMVSYLKNDVMNGYSNT